VCLVTRALQVSVDGYEAITAIPTIREKMLIGLILNLGWHEVDFEMVDSRGRALGMGLKVVYLGV